jgi:uncharacterized protein YyaL (SSP411 family)
MNLRKLLAPVRITTVLCGFVLVTVSCREKKTETVAAIGPVAVIAPELGRNELGSLPGAVYRSQAASPIHWQPWTKASLDHAKAAQRLVFCVIAMPQQPGFLKVLADLENDSAMVDAINKHYVPILVDGDAAREIGILTADLCVEIKRPLHLPLFVWMTYEGNPVAWIPVSSSEYSAVAELFNQSHTMVSQMWEDDLEKVLEEGTSGYVLKNSALDNTNRRKRLEQRKVTNAISEEPALDMVRSLRQLASLYDSYSRSFDEAGGLFPSGALELLAVASVRPELESGLRSRCLDTTRELLIDLLPSAMFDPLDGGIFTSRRGMSWAFPTFIRDCPGQARIAMALIEAYRATGNELALERALGLIAFAEKSYLCPDGLFAVGLSTEPEPEKWMWSVEDVEKVLAPEDAAWWIKATGMKGLGNLPSEVDPRREFFRLNTVGLSKPMAEIAAELSLTPEAFAPRFEAVRAKLLSIRNSRIGKTPPDESPHAASCFRMVSAYAAAFAATGDEIYLEKAVSLLNRSREAFGVGPRLRMFAREAPPSVGEGRAFLYALALQSALDVAAITADEQWLLWSEDLATTAAELFTGDGFLKECPDDARIIDLPVTDLVMLFDDSTAGLVSASESRLEALGRPLVASFSELATPMPTYAVDRPVLHTDLLLATLNRHFNMTVIRGADLPAPLDAATARLSLRSVQRRAAVSADQVPAGAVKILFSAGKDVVVTTPEALQEALLSLPE